MARYKDVEGYRKLFDEEYKKTRKLISEGEKHLDNLAEGFSEASRVIDRIPTADVVPKSEVDELIYKLECLLCHATGGRLSKHTYDLRTMETAVTDYINESYSDGKAEIAKEIFEEIDRVCIDTFGNFNHRVFADLKKKYTGERHGTTR